MNPYVEDLLHGLQPERTKASVVAARKRKMLVDFFGPQLTAALLGEKIQAEDEPPQMSEADKVREAVLRHDPYAGPYVLDLHRYGKTT